MPNELYRDFIDGKADEIVTALGGTITPAPANAELYRDFLDRKFDDVINSIDNILPIGTVTGNPVTFYTSLAKLLVECKTVFQATQSGSGTPAYNNERPVIGVYNSTFTFNDNNHFIDFNGEKFGGHIDLVNKKAVFDVGKLICDGTNMSWTDRGSYFQTDFIDGMAVANKYPSLCNWLRTDTIAIGNGIYVGSNSRRAYMGYGVWTPIGVTNFTEWNNYLQLHNLEFTYPLATPIEIPLPDLPAFITQVGNNSVSSDTGSLDVKYRCLPIDLI